MPVIDHTEQAGRLVKRLVKTQPQRAASAGDAVASYFDRSVPSTLELRDRAVRATLTALALAAKRHDDSAVANLSAALQVLEGGS